jgi:hypothetical protein
VAGGWVSSVVDRPVEVPSEPESDPGVRLDKGTVFVGTVDVGGVVVDGVVDVGTGRL